MAAAAALPLFLAILLADVTSTVTAIENPRPDMSPSREEYSFFRVLEPPSRDLGPSSRELGPPSRELGPTFHELGPPSSEELLRLLTRDHTNDDDYDAYDSGLRSWRKRSAVASALLQAGRRRRRRQPAPALGKTVTPYLGVGVLNDMGAFFDGLANNLQVLAHLTPEEQHQLFDQHPPASAPAESLASVSNNGISGGSGGGGMRHLHSLRPLRPASNIRSYNRRSFVEVDGVYPAANHHDPGLLWTGLGR